MKTLTIIMTALVVVGAGTPARAAGQQTTFEQANAAFAQKDYGRAAGDYQAILTQQGFSAPVLFNLANDYYLDGKLGLAILNFERAQLLAPDDADIALNLHVARAKAGLADRPTAWFDRATRFVSLNTLSWLGGAAVLLIGVGMVVRLLKRSNPYGWSVGMAASVCLLLATMSAIGLRWPELHRAIVTVKNAPVYIAPVTVGQPLFTLAEGQAVSLRKAHGEFVLLETSDGHRGWVNRANVSSLMPAAHETQLASQ